MINTIIQEDSHTSNKDRGTETAGMSPPMTEEEIKAAKMIVGSFRHIPVGRTAMYELLGTPIQSYEVMVHMGLAFELFGSELNGKCITIGTAAIPKMKIYSGRKITVYPYDPEVWSGVMVVPQAIDVRAWFHRYGSQGKPLTDDDYRHLAIHEQLVAQKMTKPYALEYFKTLVRFDWNYHVKGPAQGREVFEKAQATHRQISQTAKQHSWAKEIVEMFEEAWLL